MSSRRLIVLTTGRIGADAPNQYTHLWAEALRSQGIRVLPFRQRTLVRGTYDALHVHFPEAPLNEVSTRRAAVGSARNLAIVWVARLRGAQVVYTAHNLRSHDQQHPWLEAMFWRLFSTSVTEVVVLGNHALAALRSSSNSLGRLPHTVVPHGLYQRPVAEAGEQAVVRRDQAIRRIAMLGQIRAYKDHLAVLSAWRALGRDDVHLVIAGEPRDHRIASQLRSQTLGDDRVDLDLRYLSESELWLLTSHVDLVVVTNDGALNSGAIAYALSCGTPVASYDFPGARDLHDAVGENWIFFLDNPVTSQSLEGALEWLEARSAQSDPTVLERLSWSSLSRRAAGVYRQR